MASGYLLQRGVMFAPNTSGASEWHADNCGQLAEQSADHRSRFSYQASAMHQSRLVHYCRPGETHRFWSVERSSSLPLDNIAMAVRRTSPALSPGASSNADPATIGSSGLASGLSVGSTNISATFDSVDWRPVGLTVNNTPAGSNIVVAPVDHTTGAVVDELRVCEHQQASARPLSSPAPPPRPRPLDSA